MSDNSKMFYLDKKQDIKITCVKNGKLDEKVRFCIDKYITNNADVEGQTRFYTSEERYIVGLNSFSIKYKNGCDHHVKNISIELEPKLIETTNGAQEVEVEIKADMQDSSGNAAVELWVGISLIALSDALLENAEKTRYGDDEVIRLLALNGFEVEYRDRHDHHLKKLSVEMQPDAQNTSVGIFDNSGNEGSGEAYGKIIDAPRGILSEMKIKDVNIINSFSISMDAVDHHIANLGVAYSGDNAKYYLCDKHKNHAAINECFCNVNTYKALKKKE